MKMRNQMVKREQKQHAKPESRKRREESEAPKVFRLLNGRDQQAPDRSSRHHPRGKSGKGTLDRIAQ